ncbi:MAG TPA: DegT/DnrJ/EryC1/StrS family aminotransferase [Polyangia bacterium]|jgi:dTDP-4-amino-4,6-dideoxygalactose transaminase|nr:DegT/DnrJ/EryC1/StrS family aminotransferase [Polyangia bacterium]
MTARIGLANLGAQHAPLRPELEAAALRVLRSDRYILGEEVAAFERELAAFARRQCAVGVSSGSDALVAILAACGIGAGDEVITTPLSFFATAEAIVRVGARPIFADIDVATLNIDLGEARAKIGPRTRAILVVHLFGRMVDPAPLTGASVPIIEDAAQAIGASLPDGRGPGGLGTAAALSFFPAKNLGGFGDGGMVLTDDAGLGDRVRTIRAHGARAANAHETIGGNYRLDELQAALLRVKLPSLPAWTARRREIAGFYRQAWAELPLALPPHDPGCVWSQFVVRVPGGRRDALVARLAARGIDTAVYYPTPLHLQPALAAFGGKRGQLPRAEAACGEVLAVPAHAQLTADEVGRVCDEVRAFFTR